MAPIYPVARHRQLGPAEGVGRRACAHREHLGSTGGNHDLLKATPAARGAHRIGPWRVGRPQPRLLASPGVKAMIPPAFTAGSTRLRFPTAKTSGPTRSSTS